MTWPSSARRRAAKRAVDLAGASFGLVVTAPVMLGVGFLIGLTMGRPVLFCQERPGYLGRPFRLVKFRTMREPRPDEDRYGSDGDRLTRLGRFLRATSLDELPTLWNVLVGDMSLVGPRPLLVRYLERYSPEQARRHEVKPGVTGLAQVRGRNALSWEEKFSFDVWYVDHWSLALDAKILAGTLWQAVSRAGVSHEAHPTMPEFLGNANVVDAGREGADE